jgi:agmatinase
MDCGDQDVLYLKVEDLSAVTDSWETALQEGLSGHSGRDHSITFPVVRAWENINPCIRPPRCSPDYNDSIEGFFGQWKSCEEIVRASFVGEIIQIGMRGIRAREDAYSDSASRGNKIITMSEFRRRGLEKILQQIPASGNLYVTIDIDVLDPSIAPGTSSPEFDGMTYRETRDLLKGIAGLGKVVGFDVVEVNPFLDPIGLTQSAAVMMILEFLGAIFDREE